MLMEFISCRQQDYAAHLVASIVTSDEVQALLHLHVDLFLQLPGKLYIAVIMTKILDLNKTFPEIRRHSCMLANT